MNLRDDHQIEAMGKLFSARYPFNLDKVFHRRMGRMLLVFLLAAAALPLILLGLFSCLIAGQDPLTAFGAAHLPGTVIAAIVTLTALGALFLAVILSHPIS